jgi:hypothetical protein
LHQVPGKNSLRALVSEALTLPPGLGGKAVGAGDPGISTFMTVAVVDGPVLKLGEGLATHVLQSYGRHIDALEARIKDPRLVCAQRMSMARRITRLRRGAKNSVKQAAHEYALLIAARFKVFFLPHFRVSEMVVGSPLGKKVTRKMLSICHGEFRNLLVQKAALYGCQVISVRLHVCLVKSWQGQPRGLENQALGWLNIKNIDQLNIAGFDPVLPATLPILEKLKSLKVF